jgi:hypothetical protein
MSKRINSINSEKITPTREEMTEFLFAEYGKLRDEILKRTDIQHQLLSLALVATGTFIVIESVTVKLTYPILAFFLSIAWIQSDIRIRQLGIYIREHIEGRMGNIGWEYFHTPMRDLGKIGNLARFSSIGILCGTQLLTVLISMGANSFTIIEKVLLCIDIIVIIFTILLLSPHKIRSKL